MVPGLFAWPILLLLYVLQAKPDPAWAGFMAAFWELPLEVECRVNPDRDGRLILQVECGIMKRNLVLRGRRTKCSEY